MQLKRIITVFAVLLLSTAIFAQPTRIRGRVTDADSGEGIPFCGIYFQGTTVGVTSDLDGYFSLESREVSDGVLVAELLGYETRSVQVAKGAFSEINFSLKLVSENLDAAVVKPDNRYMRSILKKIDEARDRHNLEKRKTYQCRLYSKMELDLANPDDLIQSRLFAKNFAFLSDYLDTSVVSGQPYLPVMISETVARRYHTRGPDLDKEVIEASRISGLNDENAVSQFTGSLYFNANFYNPFILAFNVDIPSPLAAGNNGFYNYYLIDSLNVDGRKYYTVRFHPKKGNNAPTFDGEMSIDAEDFGLRSMHAKLKKGANINWIRDLAIDLESQRLGDSVWFYKDEKIYADFSVTMRDSSKMMSFLGVRQINYSDPSFEVPGNRELAGRGENVMVHRDAGQKGEDYWDSARPYELSAKEKGIYRMVEQVKDVPLYDNIASIVTTFIKGYYNIDKLGFGPISQFVSFNDLEGFRPRFGFRTTSSLSRHVRYTGFIAYGTKDRDFKGGLTTEIMFSNQPTSKLTLVAKRDYEQLSATGTYLNESNIISSMLTKSGGGNKRSLVNEYSITYEHEVKPGFNHSLGFEFKRIFDNALVPLIKQDGTIVPSVGANQIHYSARLSWDETVTRGAFDKYYVYTRYPVVRFDITGSQKGLGRYDYTFLRLESSVDCRIQTAPLGHGNVSFNAGHIFGNVPYPMLKLFEGNNTYFRDRYAFACMDFYEFAADTWATMFYEHNFNGFFLGRVPLLRRMQLREMASVRAAYGTIAEHNNGIVGNPLMREHTLLFPEGMGSLNKPYVELGVGITNIFRIMRVDCYWRTTHRYHEVDGVREKVPHLFSINLGFDLTF